VVNLQNGKVAAAIVGDESAAELPMGERSIALAGALGIDSNPRSGGIEKGVGYVIYPGSGNGKPGATDMRKGFEGLYGLVRDRLQCEPLSGHIFLFCNGRAIA
jgi:hypothetical protein